MNIENLCMAVNEVKVTKVSEFHGNYSIELSNGRVFTYSQRDVTHY